MEASGGGACKSIEFNDVLAKVEIDFVQPLLEFNDLSRQLANNPCSTCHLKLQHLTLASKQIQV